MALTKALGGGGGGGSGTLTTVKDEGTTLSTAVTSIDFVGAGVTATGTTAVTVTIPGGGTGRFWDVSAIPTDAAVQTSRTLDFATLGSLTGFTWTNQGSATAAIQRKRLYMVAPAGSAAHNKRILFPSSTYQVPGTTPWCVQVPVTLYGTIAFNHAGVYIKNTANGKGISSHITVRSDIGHVYAFNVTHMTNETTATTDLLSDTGLASAVIAVGFDGTTFSWWFSPDGHDWAPTAHASETAASFIGAGGTYQFGFVVDTFSTRASGGAFNNSVILNQATPVPHGQFV